MSESDSFSGTDSFSVDATDADVGLDPDREFRNDERLLDIVEDRLEENMGEDLVPHQDLPMDFDPDADDPTNADESAG